MDNASAPSDRRGGLALGAILLGLACIIVGFGILTWAPKDTSVARAVAIPSDSLASTQLPSATPVLESPATSTVTLKISQFPTLALIATPTNTPLPSPTPTPKALVLPEETSLALTIVHTNDTWGYTRPCG